jgi:hypothetical protein
MCISLPSLSLSLSLSLFFFFFWQLRIKDPKYKTKFFRKQTEALARFQVSDYPDSAPGTFF